MRGIARASPTRWYGPGIGGPTLGFRAVAPAGLGQGCHEVTQRQRLTETFLRGEFRESGEPDARCFRGSIATHHENVAGTPGIHLTKSVGVSGFSISQGI